MAEKSEEMKLKKIPLLSVLKKGSIFKNIFLYVPPPAPGHESSQEIANCGPKSAQEGMKFMVGRHPDCQIVLDHPSISRFHLEIRVQAGSQKISVTDLSSVHGTWVSDLKLQPNVPIELLEGDELRLGASTRIYKLQWVSFDQAYEIENPLKKLKQVPEENQEMYQVRSCRVFLSRADPMPLDENSEQLIKEDYGSWAEAKIPSAPPMPESMNSSPIEFYSAFEMSAKLEEVNSPKQTNLERGTQIPPNRILEQKDDLATEPVSSSMPATFHSELDVKEQTTEWLVTEAPSEIEKWSSPRRAYDGQKDFLVTESVCSSIPAKLLLGSDSELNGKDQSQELCVAEESQSDRENWSPARSGVAQKDFWITESESSSLPGNFQPKPDSQLDGHNQSPTVLQGKKIVAGIDSQSPLRSLQEKEYWQNRTQRCKSASKALGLAEEVQTEGENWSPSRTVLEQKEIWITESANSFMSSKFQQEFNRQLEGKDPRQEEALVAKEVVGEKESSLDRSLQEKGSSSIWSRRCKSASFIRIQTERSRKQIVMDLGNEIQTENRKENTDVAVGESEKSFCKALFSGPDRDDESFASDKENMTPKISGSMLKSNNKGGPVAKQLELNDSPSKFVMPNMDLEDLFPSDKENLTPSIQKSKKSISEKHSRFNPTSNNRIAPQVGENTDVVVGDREKSFCKALFSGPDREEESFTSGKENMTPKISGSMVKSYNKGEPVAKQLELNDSPSKFAMADLDLGDLFPSDKENLTPIQKSKKSISEKHSRFNPNSNSNKRIAQRIPFQSLQPLKSIATSMSGNSTIQTQTKSNSNSPSVNQLVDHTVHNVGETKTKWSMVVDTSCLLDEESRRSLRLLEGLKGTRLIIPRMVIRELDCLKRRGSWFKRDEDASSILQWIEECMMKTKCWVHVQSSVESLPIAPTPPSSPQSWLSDGNNELPGATATSASFSKFGSLMEIVSPTAEDHILECALLFRKMQSNGQIVLLTNDIALKIKAMAEGLICETAKEFRESLVNPYSDRFLWVESVPRGPTWTCLDEAAGLKENYCHYWPTTIRKTPQEVEGAKEKYLSCTSIPVWKCQC